MLSHGAVFAELEDVCSQSCPVHRVVCDFLVVVTSRFRTLYVFLLMDVGKAIGHESQIELWLALTTTLLDASDTDERRYASKMNLENRKNRRSSHQYMGWMSERSSLRLLVAGEVFSLDIPFYRPMLHALSFLSFRH